MAKASSSRGGSSKVRFIMLEADIAEGDLSQITQAIQNALRPSQSVIRTLQAPASPAALPNEVQNADLDDGEITDVDETEAAKPRPSRVGKPRVAKTPTVLDDIDVVSEPSLKDFVAQYDLPSTTDKYLVVALWFRDARATPAITADHVYTCFKLMKWSTTTNDFAKPMRNLRDEQSFKGGSKEGFTLTLPGAGKIEDKKRAP